MKKRITIAAYLAGATTLAVTLPAMADVQETSISKSVVQATDKASETSKPS